MSPIDPGRNPDIGARTASGWNTFIGRRPDADDLNLVGSGQLVLDGSLDLGELTRRTRISETPSGVPRDLKRSERNSVIVDEGLDAGRAL